MKLFKNIFGSNPNEISKHEPNTLAEINESPDMRKNDADKKIINTTNVKNKSANNSHKTPNNASKSTPAKNSTTKKNMDVKSAKKEKSTPSNSTKTTVKPTKKAQVEFDNEIKVVTTSINNEALTGSKEVGKALSKKLLEDVKDQIKANENKTPKNTPTTKKATTEKTVAENKTPAKDTKKSVTENKPASKATKSATAEGRNASKKSANTPTTSNKPANKVPSEKTVADTKTQAKTATKKSSNEKTTVDKVPAKKPTAESKATSKASKNPTNEGKKTDKVATAKATINNKPVSKALSEKIIADAHPQTKAVTNKSINENKPTASKKSITDAKNTEVKKEPTSTKPASKTASKPNEKAPVNIDTDNTGIEEVTEVKATRTGKFEIKKSKDGRYVFNLYASNNVIVATSQIYSSSTSALNGIKSVVTNASSAPIEDQTVKNYTAVPFPKWEIYKDKGEQFRFRLSASNGSCVCHSQGYTSKTNCKKGIESIIKFATDAEIIKSYINKEK